MGAEFINGTLSTRKENQADTKALFEEMCSLVIPLLQTLIYLTTITE